MSRCCRTPIPKSPGSGLRCLAKTLKHRKVKKTHQKVMKRMPRARASSGGRDAVLLHGLAEQADVLRRCLAIVDDAPVVFPGHGIQISLAQETLIVRLHQLVDGAGITAIFVEIHLDSPGILLPRWTVSISLSRRIDSAILGAATANAIKMSRTMNKTPSNRKPSSWRKLNGCGFAFALIGVGVVFACCGTECPLLGRTPCLF